MTDEISTPWLRLEHNFRAWSEERQLGELVLLFQLLAELIEARGLKVSYLIGTHD